MIKFSNEKLKSVSIKTTFAIIIGLIGVTCWFLIGWLDNKVGKVLGYVIYFLIISYSLFEYAKILPMPKWVPYYFAFLPLVSFLNPWELTMDWFSNGKETATSLNILIREQYTYKMFDIPGLGYLLQSLFVLLPFVVTKNIQSKRDLIYYVISIIVVVVLTITGKIVVFANTDSAWFLLILFIGPALCDSFSYFGGILLGNKIFKRKLAPKISPNKTIEGAIVGFLLSWLILFLIFWFNPKFNFMNVEPTILVFVVPVALPIIAIFGDLSFSLIKRIVKVKDFANIIPGHGGILDRIDSIVIACFIFLMFFMF